MDNTERRRAVKELRVNGDGFLLTRPSEVDGSTPSFEKRRMDRKGESEKKSVIGRGRDISVIIWLHCVTTLLSLKQPMLSTDDNQPQRSISGLK